MREYVESADCVLMLGTFITDMNMGIYTAKLDRSADGPGDDRVDQGAVSPVRGRGVRGLPERAWRRSSSCGRKQFKHPNPHAERRSR